MSSTFSPSSFDDSVYANYARDLVYSDPEFEALPLKVVPIISIPPAETLAKLHAQNVAESLKAAFSRAYISPEDISILPIEELKAAEALRFEVARSLRVRLHAKSIPTTNQPVGILGAGIAGLFAAMILESLEIPYKILEAQNDIGGRLFTHRFPNATGEPYNYFDVGAMRFPVTARLHELFTKLGADFQPKIKPYVFSHENEIRYYNGRRLKLKDVSQGVDHFRGAELIQDTTAGNRTKYITAGVEKISNDVVKKILGDGTPDFSKLLNYDGYSMRAYMLTKYEPSPSLELPPGPLPTDVINWAQTFDSYYDRGLAEYVLQKKLFDSRIQWKCIDGGGHQIAQHMEKSIKGPIELNSRVTSIGLSRDGKLMDVVTRTNTKVVKHQFSHVISTIPLPVLRVIDLSKAKLSTMQSNAIRTIDYGPSVKIGMQFKTAWWREEPLEITGGAQSKTDSPLRTVVYPSYGDGKSTVLIASYCWTADAERLAALIERDKSRLVETVLEELAKIHTVKLRFLREQLIDTFAWSWTNNIYTMGSTAAFGPGKFKNVYRSLTVPAAGGLLHFAGEALSTRHAWVEGALDSAWRAVLEILLKEGLDDKLEKFSKLWIASAEWVQPELPPSGGAGAGAAVAGEEEAALRRTWMKYKFFLWHVAAQCPSMFDL